MKVFFFLLVISNLMFSQIDTTDWFPLAVGNKWQYSYGIIDVKQFTLEVTGDTIMPNGKTYAIYNDLFLRNHENKFVYRYNFVDTTEHIYYDFYSEDGTVFNNSMGIKLTHPPSSWVYRFNLTSDFHEYNLPSKEYEIVIIDSSISPPDTSWGIVDIPSTYVTKGIGITPSTAYESLDGFVINGVQYGIITDVLSRNSTVENYELNQNFPNPFNPTTVINFSIPESGFVKLTVYSGIGQKVTTLVSETKVAGRYSMSFNVGNLSSGIYFYRIKVNDFTQTKKMVLLQ